MTTEQEALKQIEENKQNSSKLYSYLYDLFYEGKIKNIKFLEGIYASFLNDDRSSIRQISIYALLFGLQIRNNIYKQKAVEFIRDLRSDFDLRLFSLSGLSQAYMGTCDVELLNIFYSLFMNEQEDSDIRATCFTGMMRLVGMSTPEITRNNGSLIISHDDIRIDNFSRQLKEIREMIDN